ncbi:MAG: arsenite methyltransferase [Cyanobacteria bacterium]|nr:arsenite methyltransferase [Cyanobacteriota bacterium]
MEDEKIKKIVRESYAKVAIDNSCCCAPAANCCGQVGLEKEISANIGYSQEDIDKVPEGSNLGLGCGNPIAMASLKKGEIVLDLGSGAGFDCFLAADKVGVEGMVIGVDMTPEMIEKARENAQKGNYKNVEFRLGEIENLPVSDGIIDIIISNCVINLSTAKDRVFAEAFRVLKPEGRLMVSDIVLTKELPDFIKNNMSAYTSCISGAIMKDDYLNAIIKAGFISVKIIDEISFPLKYYVSDNTVTILENDLNLSEDQIKDLEDSISSIKVSALKTHVRF